MTSDEKNKSVRLLPVEYKCGRNAVIQTGRRQNAYAAIAHSKHIKSSRRNTLLCTHTQIANRSKESQGSTLCMICLLAITASQPFLSDCICLYAFDWRAPSQSTHKQLTQTIFTLYGVVNGTVTHIFRSHISCLLKGGLNHLSHTFSMLMAVSVCYITFNI